MQKSSKYSSLAYDYESAPEIYKSEYTTLEGPSEGAVFQVRWR